MDTSNQLTTFALYIGANDVVPEYCAFALSCRRPSVQF